MGDRGRVEDARELQQRRSVAEIVEQPDTVAQEHLRDVDLDLVNESGAKVLLRDVGSACDVDVLGACGFSGRRYIGISRIGPFRYWRATITSVELLRDRSAEYEYGERRQRR